MQIKALILATAFLLPTIICAKEDEETRENSRMEKTMQECTQACKQCTKSCEYCTTMCKECTSECKKCTSMCRECVRSVQRVRKNV